MSTGWEYVAIVGWAGFVFVLFFLVIALGCIDSLRDDLAPAHRGKTSTDTEEPTS